jgi:hypothetical protein
MAYNVTPTHSDLVKIAERWLRNRAGCGYVITELKSFSSEIPDAFGFRVDYTVLIECKTSHTDFVADLKKPFRQHPETGIGDFRFYLTLPDIIKPEDLPPKWGLLYWDGKRVCRINCPSNNTWTWGEWLNFRFEKDFKSEYALMYSILRRLP